MLLHRIHLDLRCREVRRDLADPYEMHATLCRAFASVGQKCPPGTFLWRLEPEASPSGAARVLVQSLTSPDWSRIGVEGWLAEQPEAGIDLQAKLALASLVIGRRFRYRIRGNPCVCKDGKRTGLLGSEDQRNWIARMEIPSAYSQRYSTGSWSLRIRRSSWAPFDQVSATERPLDLGCYRWLLRNRASLCCQF